MTWLAHNFGWLFAIGVVAMLGRHFGYYYGKYEVMKQWQESLEEELKRLKGNI